MSYHERHLPHWQPGGAALFVTWRLHGSLPGSNEVLKGQSAGQQFVAIDRVLDRAATGPRWLGTNKWRNVSSTHYSTVNTNFIYTVCEPGF